VALPAVEAGRSSLLADIRQGHITRLKKASTRKLDDKKDPKKGKKSKNNKDAASASAAAPAASSAGPRGMDPSASTGDIFGDLLVALNRRRAGIAEKQADKPSKPSEDITLPETTESDWA